MSVEASFRDREITRVGETTILVGSNWVYRTQSAAEAWLAVAADPAYGYHAEELLLLDMALEGLRGSGTEAFSSMICLGAADSAKELATVNALATDPESTLILCLDNSAPLLAHAVHRFQEAGYARVMGRAVDICDAGELQNALATSDLSTSHRVFTLFGNTLGNYDSTDVLHSIGRSMVAGDLLLLGIHLAAPSAPIAAEWYIGYGSRPYLDHMRRILSSIGVPPSSGRLSWRVTQDSQEGNGSHVVEILHEFHSPASLTIHAADTSTEIITKELIVDTSSKFGPGEVREALSKAKLEPLGEWRSERGRTAVIACVYAGR